MKLICSQKVLILFSLYFFDCFNIYAQNLPHSAYLKSILIEDFEELSQSFIYKDEGNYFVKKDDKYLLKRERTSEFFKYFIGNLKESHYSLELDIKIDPTTNSSGGLYISGKPNPKIIFEINNHQEFRIIVREHENKILTTNEDTNGWIHSSHITSTGEFQNIEWVVDNQKHAIYINSALVYTFISDIFDHSRYDLGISTGIYISGLSSILIDNFKISSLIPDVLNKAGIKIQDENVYNKKVISVKADFDFNPYFQGVGVQDGRRVNSTNYDFFKEKTLFVWNNDGTYEQVEPYEHNNFEDLLNKFEKVSPTQYKNTFKQNAPANLKVTDLKFKDDNGNGLLEANEEALITFDVLNSGNGDAHNVKINIEWGNIVEGLSCSSPTDIYSIKSKQSKHVEIPIKGLDYLVSSEQNLTISITEANGFDADPFSISFNTEAFRPPNLEIVDYKFSSPSGVLKLASPLSLEFALQNLGMGVAENVSIKMILPTNVYPTDETEFSIKKLQPGETKVLKLDFFTNKRYSSKELNISVSVSEALNKYGFEKTLSEELDRSVDSDLSLNVRSTIDNEKLTSAVFSLSSKVDKNIPKNPKVKNRFALIVGNEDYTSYQSGLSTEQNVDYAVNDARVFKDYAINTLGIREENLFHLSNATAGKMSSEIERITKLVKLKGEDAELIFYYAGHGFPDEETKIPYLIPVDVTVSDLSRAIKLSDIYHKFEETNAKRVTVFLDACFTGGSRNLGLLASRGVKIRPKQEEMNGNLIVFSASSEEQSALPFHREKHGIFTYHLLKKIQESQGNISYGDLFDYLQEMVQETSLRYNSKEQEPKVNTSPHIVNIWRDFKF